METSQTTTLQRPEYWEESRRLEETCCHSNTSERPSVNADVKNSQGVNNDNNNFLFSPIGLTKNVYIYVYNLG